MSKNNNKEILQKNSKPNKLVEDLICETEINIKDFFEILLEWSKPPPE